MPLKWDPAIGTLHFALPLACLRRFEALGCAWCVCGFLRLEPERSCSDQVVVVGVGRGRRPRTQIQLRENIAQVASYGLLADIELSRDLPVGNARCDQSEYLQFPLGKWP